MEGGTCLPAFLGKVFLTECRWRILPLAFSPLVEETAVDTVVIDAEGCELLFGSAYELANKISNCAAKPKQDAGLGCKVNVALAGNPDAAIHAARFFNGHYFYFVR